MKTHIKFVAGIAVGVLLATIFWTVYVVTSPVVSPSKARLDFALNELDEEQKRLGFQCVDVDKFILDYIDAATLVVGELVNGKRLVVSDPIILMGENVSNAIRNCAALNAMLEADNVHILSKPALVDILVEQDVAIIRLALPRANSKTCDAECINGVRKEVIENSLLIRRHLSQESHVVGSSDVAPETKGTASQ